MECPRCGQRDCLCCEHGDNPDTCPECKREACDLSNTPRGAEEEAPEWEIWW